MSIKLIERWNTEELIEFFKRQDIISLHLEDEEYEIIRKIKMSGTSFLFSSKMDLFQTALEWGPVIEIYNLRERVISGIFKYIDKFLLIIINLSLLFSN